MSHYDRRLLLIKLNMIRDGGYDYIGIVCDHLTPKSSIGIGSHNYILALFLRIQWNPVNTVTNVPKQYGRINGVRSISIMMSLKLCLFTVSRGRWLGQLYHVAIGLFENHNNTHMPPEYQLIAEQLYRSDIKPEKDTLIMNWTKRAKIQKLNVAKEHCIPGIILTLRCNDNQFVHAVINEICAVIK